MGWAAIEAKNVRSWVYPNDDEIHALLAKAVALDCVPVLIARRFAFVTFKVLWTCGVVFHQNYGQLLPATAAELAEQAKDKELLGYHDIRLGNEPDQRLQKFIGRICRRCCRKRATGSIATRTCCRPLRTMR